MSTLFPDKQIHGLITEFWTFVILSISKQLPFLPITHDVYMAVFIGESLNTQVEPGNVHDKYAVKVLKNEAVVGLVPREISRYCSFVLNSGGTISATVTGARENRRGKGLTVPCKYKS